MDEGEAAQEMQYFPVEFKLVFSMLGMLSAKAYSYPVSQLDNTMFLDKLRIIFWQTIADATTLFTPQPTDSILIQTGVIWWKEYE